MVRLGITSVLLSVLSVSIPEVHGSIANGVHLKILPFGASITYGTDSSTGNGYRSFLRDLLQQNGNNVSYVGTHFGGDMTNNAAEAIPGYTVGEMMGQADKDGTWDYRPNVMLILCGTNNCAKSGNKQGPAEMGRLLADVNKHIPDALIVVAGVPHNRDPAQDACIKDMNDQFAGVVSSAPGNVVYTNMYDLVPMDEIDAKDKTHPHDPGYQLIAHRWFDMIQAHGGSLKSPDPNGKAAPVSGGVGKGSHKGEQCEKKNAVIKGPIRIQKGSGSDDGPYKAANVSLGRVFDGPPGVNGSAIHFADLDGDGLDEYIMCNDTHMGVAMGLGGSKFSDYREYPLGFCKLHGIQFRDINADGKADFICISPNGDLQGWINTPGTDNDKRTRSWKSLGLIKPNEGYNQSRVRLGDVDGDGRVDYMVIHDNGDVHGWRNGGVGDKPAFWQDLGRVFNGEGVGDLEGFSFGDMNADGRDDFNHINEHGVIHTYINHRGHSVGLVPNWVNAGVVYAGAGYNRSNIRLGRVHGSGRLDYLHVLPKGSIDEWENSGSGGKLLKGDGVRYCDMLGHGRDDYVWLDSKGKMTLFENIGAPPEWGHRGVVFQGYGDPRELVHLVDLDGDGKCDYVYVDPKTGDVRMHKNLGLSSDGKALKFDAGTKVFIGGPNTCLDPGVQVQFADINADGKGDLLCVHADGATKVWLNTGPVAGTWKYLGVAFPSVGADRANLRFADINGDGRADYLWVDKFKGSVKAWVNRGVSGKKLNLESQGQVAPGVGARGECMKYANIHGLGRADYIDIDPSTAGANAHFNTCPGGDETGVGGTGPTTTSSTTSPTPTDTPDGPDLEIDIPPYCADMAKYPTVQSVLDSGLTTNCLDLYLLNSMALNMSGSLSDYQKIMKDDYPDKFKAYKKQVISQRYWTFNDDIWSPKKQDTYWTCYEDHGGDNKTVSCGGTPDGDNYYYVAKDSLCDDLDKKFGLDCKAISQKSGGYNPPDHQCGLRGCLGPAESTIYYPTFDETYGDVLDPSTTLSKSLDGYAEIADWMEDSANSASVYTYYGSIPDTIDGSSTVVFSLSAAVIAMQQIADIGEKAAADARKELIVGFLTGFLLLIPGLGELTEGTEALVQVGRVLRTLDVAGNAALDIYSAVDDPANAGMAILDFISVAKQFRNEDGFSAAAHRFRNSDEGFIKSLGKDVSENVGKVTKKRHSCAY